MLRTSESAERHWSENVPTFELQTGLKPLTRAGEGIIFVIHYNSSFTIKACHMCADHQGSSPGLPPENRLPLLRLHEGSVLWLVCPGGKVSHYVPKCFSMHQLLCFYYAWLTRKSWRVAEKQTILRHVDCADVGGNREPKTSCFQSNNSQFTHFYPNMTTLTL